MVEGKSYIKMEIAMMDSGAKEKYMDKANIHNAKMIVFLKDFGRKVIFVDKITEISQSILIYLI